MKEAEDKVLDEEQWKLEAQAVINDVKQHVTDIKLSEKLQKLSAAGFTIVGNQHDDTSNAGNEHFETPYSLLDSVSPQYRSSFGSSLFAKLKKLSDEQ
ncbi:PREDICTED: GSK3-beta interaction protein isoform X2 [Dufourea novaeangliae]|uniref:GSK3-beta interaction protein isoform X2 n=1 Tax=Dufourea novaeangliae TaxID=178035 RepID=UPI000767492D|nr:PREDICTED: GSK3-beta interaction protein isoform X2 [Dufourea novaeangliae]